MASGTAARALRGCNRTLQSHTTLRVESRSTGRLHVHDVISKEFLNDPSKRS